jgi:D-aminopeptidase
MSKSKKKKSAVKVAAEKKARVRKLKLRAAEVLRIETEKNARALVAHHEPGVVHIAAIAEDDARFDEPPKVGWWRTLIGY